MIDTGQEGTEGSRNTTNRLSSGTATDPHRLPVDPRTGEPLAPREQPGYYPRYSTLGQQDYWDHATRQVVLDRVNNVPPIRFFTADEARLLEAICDRVLPQDDRIPERRVPLVTYIDARQHEGVTDGYRFEDMPPDGEAMRMGLRAVEEMARFRDGRSFPELSLREQEELLKSIHDGKPEGAQEIWERLPAGRFWQLLVQFAAEAYYSHPWAWDEIGYGGPAYPRGYMRLENGLPEPWEVDEQRYEWEAPPDSISGSYEPIGGRRPPPSQAGTN